MKHWMLAVALVCFGSVTLVGCADLQGRSRRCEHYSYSLGDKVGPEHRRADGSVCRMVTPADNEGGGEGSIGEYEACDYCIDSKRGPYKP